jgi:hypothetical protein
VDEILHWISKGPLLSPPSVPVSQNETEVKSAAVYLGQYREGDCVKCFAGSGKKFGHTGQHRTRQFPTTFTAEMASAVEPPLACALNYHRDKELDAPSLPIVESSLSDYCTGRHKTITAISAVDPHYIAGRVESPAVRKCSAAFPTPVLVKCGTASLNSAIANLAEVKSAAVCLGQYRESDCVKCFAGSGKKFGHTGQHRAALFPTAFTAEVVSAVEPSLVCALNHTPDEMLGGRRRTSNSPTRFFPDTSAQQSQLE